MPGSARAAVLNADGLVVNVIELDPGSDWRPSPGLSSRLLPDDSPVRPGQMLDMDSGVPREVLPPASTPELSLEERLAALEELGDYLLGVQLDQHEEAP